MIRPYLGPKVLVQTGIKTGGKNMKKKKIGNSKQDK